MAEARLSPPRKAGEAVARNLVVAGEAEVLRREEEVVEVAAGCQHGQREEVEEEGEGEDSHRVEVGEEVAAEEVGLLHPLVRVVEVVLRAQVDPPQSANTGGELLLADTSA